MTRHSDQNKALARMVGLDVREDSDQAGRYVWVQTDEKGAVVGGCDTSFDTEDDAWDEVVQAVVGETMAYFDLASEQWDALDAQAQQNRVREAILGE